ncbi:MAG: adenylate kinase family protein [Methanomassiliicoccales archaeon]|nr:adenylate kinase family protein [Methanomassiliicoccales archaeon]
MIVAITGTPGTGKSTVCRELARRGFTVVDAARLASEKGLSVRSKRPGSPAVVDIDRLRRVRLPKADLVFVYSHFSHLLKSDITIVLRCSPAILKIRLQRRKWRKEKVMENVEAEAIDLITVEATQRRKKVFEVDTTSIDAGESARQILEIVKGSVKGHEPGHIDWSEEIMSWF